MRVLVAVAITASLAGCGEPNKCVVGEINVEPWSGPPVVETSFTCDQSPGIPCWYFPSGTVDAYSTLCRTAARQISLMFRPVGSDRDVDVFVHVQIDYDMNNGPVAARAGYRKDDGDAIAYIGGLVSIEGDYIDDDPRACIKGRLRVETNATVSEGTFVSFYCPPPATMTPQIHKSAELERPAEQTQE